MKRFLIILSILINIIFISLFVYNKFFDKDINNSNSYVENKETTNNSIDEKKESNLENSNSSNDESKEISTNNTNSDVSNNKEENRKFVLNIKQQIQQKWNYCAPTAVSMMLSAKDINVDQHQLAKDMGTYEPFGTHNKDAIRILNKYMFGYEFPSSNQSGYRLEYVSEVNERVLKLFEDRLKENIKNGYPMYYTFDVSKLYEGKKGEHNVIGIGYKLKKDSDAIDYLYYIDPSPNVQDSVYGGLKIIEPRKLLEAMLTCEEPNYAW